MENKNNKINMKYYYFYRWVCVCVCVCVYMHQTVLSLKFHKLKVLLGDKYALSARNRIIQLKRSLGSAN